MANCNMIHSALQACVFIRDSGMTVSAGLPHPLLWDIVSTWLDDALFYIYCFELTVTCYLFFNFCCYVFDKVTYLKLVALLSYITPHIQIK